MSFTANQGDQIEIRQSFTDVNGNLSDVSNVVYRIYPYGKSPAYANVETSDALVEGTPEHMGLGQYRVLFDIPEEAQVGVWYVQWEGLIGTTSVSAVTEFIVSGDGIGYPGSEYEGIPVLYKNSIYSISLEDISSVDGDTIDYNFSFTSQYSPMCSSYRAIYNRISFLVSDLNVDNVNYLIWQATLKAKNLIPRGVSCNPTFLKTACQQYVEYLVSYSVLTNIVSGGGQMKSKQLGDLRVAYSDNSVHLSELMKTWADEVAEWEKVLRSNACITYKGSINMGIAHPSLYSPDRPKVGRQIREPLGGDIAVNDKDIYGNRTRGQASYKSPSLVGDTLLEWHYD